MKYQVSFKNMHHDLSTYHKVLESETEKLQKFIDPNHVVRWTCSNKGNFYHVELHFVGSHFSRHSSAKTDHFEKSCEMAVLKLVKQLEKLKDFKNNKMHRRLETPVVLDPEDAWMEYEEDYFADVG